MAAPIYKGGRPFFKPGIRFGNNVLHLAGSATPTNGTSGTGAGQAGPGSVYSAATGIVFVNQGTKASPFWVPVYQPLQNTYAVDGAVSVVSQIALLTKGTAGAYTVAAPGTAGVGARITLMTASDAAHVVTFTGSTLRDGTTGAKVTWTSVAFTGAAITVVGISATLWGVESKNLGTVA